MKLFSLVVVTENFPSMRVHTVQSPLVQFLKVNMKGEKVGRKMCNEKNCTNNLVMSFHHHHPASKQGRDRERIEWAEEIKFNRKKNMIDAFCCCARESLQSNSQWGIHPTPNHTRTHIRCAMSCLKPENCQNPNFFFFARWFKLRYRFNRAQWELCRLAVDKIGSP